MGRGTGMAASAGMVNRSGSTAEALFRDAGIPPARTPSATPTTPATSRPDDWRMRGALARATASSEPVCWLQYDAGLPDVAESLPRIALETALQQLTDSGWHRLWQRPPVDPLANDCGEHVSGIRRRQTADDR